jgi:hypothetical protein
MGNSLRAALLTKLQNTHAEIMAHQPTFPPKTTKPPLPTLPALISWQWQHPKETGSYYTRKKIDHACAYIRCGFLFPCIRHAGSHPLPPIQSLASSWPLAGWLIKRENHKTRALVQLGDNGLSPGTGDYGGHQLDESASFVVFFEVYGRCHLALPRLLRA